MASFVCLTIQRAFAHSNMAQVFILELKGRETWFSGHSYMCSSNDTRLPTPYKYQLLSTSYFKDYYRVSEYIYQESLKYGRTVLHSHISFLPTYTN